MARATICAPRLTHSIEVASISRTIARALGLNEDLAEAIALAHDLGHSPFGHSGEEMLAECMADHGGFDHNKQSQRVVELLENAYPDFPGLNLTFEVREGLKKHQAFYEIVAQPSRFDLRGRVGRSVRTRDISLSFPGSADRQSRRRDHLLQPRPR